MNTPADAARPQAIEIRFGQVGLVQLRLHTVDPGAILDELTGRTATAPHFFERTAVCLDLSALGPAPEAHQVRAVVDVIRRAGLLSVGLAQGPASAEALARELDVPVLTHIRIPNRPVPVVQAAPEVALQPAQMQHQPVRSGQRIYARNRDLIVTTTVAAGAEVMADGCVHIYGPLRGRVMAGVHGETSARMFCQEFHAELVSIAGIFRVFETIPPELAGAPVQAWLAGEELHVARIGAGAAQT
ncbi:MAG TPA: septum site-determining protein MinC [Steroidobacteraceae bacterium]|nr:septum site-determining protein MinC [Steroidobacteraceae bacterium]